MTEFITSICMGALILWLIFTSIITITILFSDKMPLNLHDNSFPAEVISVEKSEEGFEYRMESERLRFYFKSTEVYPIGTKFDLVKQ
jgi:hypothetical protein